jgi:hypothetical protein
MSSFPRLRRAVLCAFLGFGLATAADTALTLDLTLVEGTGDEVMIVAWLEKEDGTFVRTLQWFSEDRKYFKDLNVWEDARAGRENDQQVDAVVGPTIVWGGRRTVRVPLPEGLGQGLVLRIEQYKDKAGHYKKYKAKLTADFTGVSGEKSGYIAKLAITPE